VSSELAESTSYHIVENSATQLQAGGDNIFNFDYVFGTDTDQQTIYEDCVLPLVGSAFEGFNSTILAYGQTGSGKTYTMGSSYDITVNPNGEGIIPRVVRSVFELIEQQDLIDGRRRTKICVQFLEIYGEDLIDLLDVSKSSRVAIHETAQGEVFISGATEVEVSSYEQMMRQLEKGTKQRTTASTKMNQSSSRSHAIFTMYMEQTLYSASSTGMDGDGDSETAVEETPEIRKCKFSFVDLAGSERASRTGTEGKQFREGIDINKGAS
jgi:kinesin family protein 4/21/27